jgi:hypothetical protein
MSSAAARRLAHAIRQGARQHDRKAGRRVYRGVIRTLSPLSLDLLGVDLTLDDRDVELSQDVLRYDASEGLRVGDTLALLEVQEGDWIAVSVVSDTTIRPVP